MLKNDEKGDYFLTGMGTARRIVRLNGMYSVTYIAHGIPGKNAINASRKRSRVAANAD